MWFPVRLSAVLLITLAVMDTQGSKETMKDITSGFFKVLNECKHELNLPDHLVGDFYHYWRQEYALLDRDLGCAILCMSRKLELIDASGKLHHGNTQEFAEKHGADNSMASKLVEVLHACEKQHEGVTDDCQRALEVAKCFRSSVHELGWAPTIDVIIEEVLTDM
uniref:Pheromone-binding protein 3B n=1 Tax=Plutella xylostella TaxID=51655 RepID=A0A410RAI9_PLUXY|nr:pheromone-binding protein 3B [Plutella xylostella]